VFGCRLLAHSVYTFSAAIRDRNRGSSGHTDYVSAVKANPKSSRGWPVTRGPKLVFYVSVKTALSDDLPLRHSGRRR